MVAGSIPTVGVCAEGTHLAKFASLELFALPAPHTYHITLSDHASWRELVVFHPAAYAKTVLLKTPISSSFAACVCVGKVVAMKDRQARETCKSVALPARIGLRFDQVLIE